MWYKLTHNLLQINSFRALFKLLWGKFSLSIYVTGVKKYRIPVILLTCDKVSSGSGQFFLDDCSVFFLCSNLFFACLKSVKLTNSPKFALFSTFFRSNLCLLPIFFYSFCLTDTILVLKCFEQIEMK